MGVALETEMVDGLPPVRGNGRQLEDLWVNLLLLARDAVAAGQGHAIRLRSLNGTNGWVQVEIQDDGLPVSAAELSSIFEPNFIGSTSGRGTGLELSICREIVRQHGGQISAEVTPQKQTIMRVILPAES
jgi:signal transduction histidine kinase